MVVRIEINIDNAAFCDNPGSEVARILREEADRLENDKLSSQSLVDFNGNYVGKTRIQ